MKQFNPSYNEVMNASKSEFTFVVRVPMLPPASAMYSTKVVLNKIDRCFYSCIEHDGKWIWEKITFGPTKTYILPVTWIPTPYVFDDEVNTIKELVKELRKRNVDIAELIPADASIGVTLNEACAKTNEIITYVNWACAENLDLVPDGLTLDTTTYPDATCEELAYYLNAVIGALNPHAGSRIEHKKLWDAIEELRAQQSGVTYVETEDATPVEGKVYYIENDQGEKVLASEDGTLEEFEAGVTYFEVKALDDVSVDDFNELRNTVSVLGTRFSNHTADYDQYKVNVAGKFNNLEGRIEALETWKTTVDSTLATHATKFETIIKNYIGWNTATDTETVISRITRLFELYNSISGSAGGLASRVGALETNLAAEVERATREDSKHDDAVAKVAKYEEAFTQIAAIDIGEDPLLEDLENAFIQIKQIAAAAIADNEEENNNG